MTYKNKLSSLAMLLLAATMTFVTSCKDEAKDKDSDESQEKKLDTPSTINNGAGDRSQSATNEHEAVLPAVGGTQATNLEGYRKGQIAAINKIKDNVLSEALRNSLVAAFNRIKLSRALVGSAAGKNVDDAALLAIGAKLVEAAKGGVAQIKRVKPTLLPLFEFMAKVDNTIKRQAANTEAVLTIEMLEAQVQDGGYEIKFGKRTTKNKVVIYDSSQVTEIPIDTNTQAAAVLFVKFLNGIN